MYFLFFARNRKVRIREMLGITMCARVRAARCITVCICIGCCKKRRLFRQTVTVLVMASGCAFCDVERSTTK